MVQSVAKNRSETSMQRNDLSHTVQGNTGRNARTGRPPEYSTGMLHDRGMHTSRLSPQSLQKRPAEALELMSDMD